MSSRFDHLTDEQLVRAANDELSSRQLAHAREHLSYCGPCHSRLREIEAKIGEVAQAQSIRLANETSPAYRTRAQLESRLTEIAAPSKGSSWHQFIPLLVLNRRALALASAFLLVILLGEGALQMNRWRRANSDPLSSNRGLVPDRELTPGATRTTSMNTLCSMPHEEVIRPVSDSLRRDVFNEYGIVIARADDYEIDYLIAPGLGGADDLHNLWPEPYASPIWNARVKDSLEERLHELVCSGQVSLSTAQRDIATDWIAAYKKYFHTEKPVAENSAGLISRSRPPQTTSESFLSR